MPQDLSQREAQLAAQLRADVTIEHLANVYAEAFLGAAQKAEQTDALLEEFDSLLADVLDGFPGLERVLGSALVSHEEKTGILDRAFGGRISPLLLNFLKVLSRHGRLDLLRPIHRRAHQQYDRLGGRIRVRLTTPVAIDEEFARGITESFRELVGGEPVLERAVDPALIGGAVVQIGDMVYDGSVAMQLERVRQQIIDRSAHEIQSRRDRFRDPAGD